MCRLGWGEGGDAWRWRKQLFVWEEEMLGELTLLLQSVNLQVDREDRWLWKLEPSNTFSVSSAYHFLIAQPTVSSMSMSQLIWHKDIPLKILFFAWRLFRARLPTKDNLYRRGVIGADLRMCVSGWDSLESSSHLFLHCNFFGYVWHYIYRWLGISSVTPNTVTSHFTQFMSAAGGANPRQSMMQVFWFATVWEIWKVFENIHFEEI